MSKAEKIILIVAILTLIPIWRATGVDKGMNAWEILGYWKNTDTLHIPFEDAVRDAKKAYENEVVWGSG